MDIQQWLAATADRAPPLSSDDHRLPDDHRFPDAAWAHTHSQDREQRRGRSSQRKKTKRAWSESSIIAPRAPRPTNRSRAQAAPRSLPSEQARSADCADSRSGESAYSSPHASGSPENAPQKTYERRLRYKTRPDRYERKQRKRKGDQDARKERKPGKKRRKSHRSADGGRTAGLVQSFQLKNGPKNSRLTMKLGATAGLFKHGRASAQMTGRGSGLPDLVFNEMRFLQRPAEHQYAPLEALEQQQRSKSDRKRPNDGDISAYFSAKNPAHEQQENDRDPHLDRKRSGRGWRTAQESTRRRQRTPPVELSSRPFLRFGGKESQSDSKEAHSEHPSYLSWSQTPAQEPPSARRRPVITPTFDVDEVSIRKPKENQPDTLRKHQPGGNEHCSEERSAHQRRSPQHGQGVRTRRGKGAALVGRYEPQGNQVRCSVGERRSKTKTTSQSLPRGLAERHSEGRRKVADSQTHDGYHTSEILKIHDYNATLNGLKSDGRVPVVQSRSEKENQGHTSSLSIDRLLDDVRHLAYVNMVEARSTSPEQDHKAQRYVGNQHLSISRNSDTTLPVRGETTYPLREQPRPPPLPQRREAFAYAGHRTASVPDTRHFVQQLPRGGIAQRHPPADHGPTDEETLDNGQGLDSRMWLHGPVYASMQQAEDLVYGSRSNADPDMYEALSERSKSETTSLWRQHARTPSNTLLGRSLSMGTTIGCEWVTGPVSRDVGEGMSGFWKPNKLY